MLSNPKITRPSDAFDPEECQENGANGGLTFKPVLHAASMPQQKCLSQGEILRLEGNHRQERIQVLRGTVWVTQPGDVKDHILKAGECFQIQRAGLVLAQGLSSATLRIGR